MITRRTSSSSDARCPRCPGLMILWADRAKHTIHLLPDPDAPLSSDTFSDTFREEF